MSSAIPIVQIELWAHSAICNQTESVADSYAHESVLTRTAESEAADSWDGLCFEALVRPVLPRTVCVDSCFPPTLPAC